jgi:hypothetical protein
MPAFYFHDALGNLRQGPETVFPILTMLDFGTPHQRYQYVATASFIHPRGVFVTAKHALLDNAGNQLFPAIAIHQYGRFTCVRHLQNFRIHLTDDIAVGELNEHCGHNGMRFGPQNLVAALPSSIEELPIDHYIRSFAYPRSELGTVEENFVQNANFIGNWSEGLIEEYHPNGRDRVFLPGRCYRTSMPVLAGASGGPVFNEEGYIIGVNSTSFGEEPPSHITPLEGILDLQLFDHYAGPSMTVRELFAQPI